MAIIEVMNLTRVFKSTNGIIRRKTKEIVALDGIDFEVKKGELFGILGPNGAGKTTTVKILTTLLTPSAGSAHVLGYDVVHEERLIRKQIGFVFGGERGLYWRLSAYDNMVYFSNLYNMDPAVQKRRIPQVLEMVGLGGRGDERVQGYSRGMKQRLHIARALLHDPEILFLDEPTIGLDPIGALELRQTIIDLQAEKKTILLTTHYMFEADKLCDWIAIINHGKIIALDTPVGLKRYVQNLAAVTIVVTSIVPDLAQHIEKVPGVELLSCESSELAGSYTLTIHTNNGPAIIAPVVGILEGLGLEVGNITIHEPTLEDAYIRLVGEGA